MKNSLHTIAICLSVLCAALIVRSGMSISGQGDPQNRTIVVEKVSPANVTASSKESREALIKRVDDFLAEHKPVQKPQTIEEFDKILAGINKEETPVAYAIIEEARERFIREGQENEFPKKGGGFF